MTIKNREEIIEQLTDMLIQFDKDLASYQTDVYLYYNKEEQTATLDTFVNVGGNSWLDDDHHTIYCDQEHHEDVFDWYNNVQELAENSEISVEQLRSEVIAYYELDEEAAAEYNLTFDDAQEYLKKKDNYMEKLTAAYRDGLDEMRSDYTTKAELIIERFEEEEE